MKKIIFLLILALASSLWTLSSALCIARAPQAMQQPTRTLSGFLLLAGTPCDNSDPETPCADCMTLAFEASGTLYYLTSDDSSMETQLNEIEAKVYSKKFATVTGILYQQGSYNYINVQNISLNNDPLPSLCDEWNVLAHYMDMGPEYESFRTYHYCLTHDTVINSANYAALEKGGQYKGAMREGSDRDIYFIPAGSTHEYLLYAFNAQVGDAFTNVWTGGDDIYIPYEVYVENIKGESPRVFELRARLQNEVDDTPEADYGEWPVFWIEGIGSAVGPCGDDCPLGWVGCAGLSVLCAYKNGEQVYASGLSKQYGCEYNYDPFNSISWVQSSDAQCSKILRNGQILILRGDRTYTLTGQEIK